MTVEQRLKAVVEFGFTERFLVTVMLHGGVCVPRQYAAFAGIAYGHKVNVFFDKLVHLGFAGARWRRCDGYGGRRSPTVRHAWTKGQLGADEIRPQFAPSDVSSCHQG